MARPLRIEYPGAYYHVINRGNGGEKVFKRIGDKKKFLEYLEKTVKRFSLKLHTYCLMTNHYHLLIETPQQNLSVAIQWLNVSYAAYYNRRHKRNGHIFQGRYKAVLIDADEYLGQLSRYIHLNPVRAGMVTAAGQYPWSSYSAFIGKTKAPAWLETGGLLGYFGKQKKRAIRNYRNFVEGIDAKTLEDPGKNIVGGFILGGTDFVGWVRETFLSKMDGKREISQLNKLKSRPSLKNILQAVCEEFRCSEEDILARGRKKNKVRDIAIYLARDFSGLSCKEAGAFFSGISGAAITMRYKQVAGDIARDKSLRRKANRIRKHLML